MALLHFTQGLSRISVLVLYPSLSVSNKALLNGLDLSRMYSRKSKNVCACRLLPVVTLPDFNQLFEVECDGGKVGIRVVLVQNKHLIAYFSEKLNEAKKNYFYVRMTKSFMLLCLF